MKQVERLMCEHRLQGAFLRKRWRIAVHLPADERRLLVQTQLKRAASPSETGDNRGDHYIAAANLALGLDNTDDLFEEAMRRAADASPSWIFAGSVETGGLSRNRCFRRC